MRSLEFDDIQPHEKIKLIKGGNRKFLELINLYKLEFMDMHDVFITKACDFYRQILDEACQNNVEFEVNKNLLEILSIRKGYLFIYNRSIMKERQQQMQNTRLMTDKKKEETNWFGEIMNFNSYVVSKLRMSCVGDGKTQERKDSGVILEDLIIPTEVDEMPGQSMPISPVHRQHVKVIKYKKSLVR